MQKQVTAAIAGLGSRGKDVYAPMSRLFPEKLKITAVADPDPSRAMQMREEYRIEEDRCFGSAEEMLEQPRLADVMIIATQDRQHVRQAVRAMERGYDILLEKPVSPELDECREIVRRAEELKRKVVVCHVLRYTPFYQTVKSLLDAGRIGEVVSVMAVENVGYWHQAHSFVRGSWRDSDTTSPMILQKCCHDMDMLLWLTGKTCESVSSYGDTYLFKKEKAPAGAAHRCTGGCRVKEACPFDAEKIYLTDKETGVLEGNCGWPANVLTMHPDGESVRRALEEGPYGRCVYYCDNNVVDHQVVNMNMTDGSTVSFTMCGFTADCSRYAKLMGTKGQIIADMGANTIEVTPFGKDAELIDVSRMAEDFSGHGGGDRGLVIAFLDFVTGEQSEDDTISSVERSLESHYIALAAEESRRNGGAVIRMEQVRK